MAEYELEQILSVRTQLSELLGEDAVAPLFESATQARNKSAGAQSWPTSSTR
jgi:hypothetical protein